MRTATKLRRRLLEAAAETVLQGGAQALTLDAVARRAGASKGGLLHHFASKSELLDALWADRLARFEADLERFMQDDPAPQGRHIRAYINVCAHAATTENRLGIPVLTSLMCGRNRMRTWQEAATSWLERDSPGTDPIQTRILRLAADGLWLGETSGLSAQSSDQRAAVVARLLAMTRP